jgi:poly(3-hydroxybutyrate) depolymerase
MRIISILFGLFLNSSTGFAASSWGIQKLPALSLDMGSISVSGLSAGAFMAVQLGVAYSGQIHGVSAIAGGIYGCAEGKADKATNICMKDPTAIKSASSIDLANYNFNKGLIDSPSNLAQQRVFILNGQEDKTVLPVAGQKLVEFYTALKNTPKMEFNLKMGHAFPSAMAKNACEVSQFPWLNNCQYDGAKEILENMYGPLLKHITGDKLLGELLTIDQKEFGADDAKMLAYGHAYVPYSCRNGNTHCRLHVALHGCFQGPNIAQRAFIEGAGYNDWAVANQIVILYPAVDMGAGNPNGCWDWFGYTGSNYAVKSSLQMTAIMKMVSRLTEN